MNWHKIFESQIKNAANLGKDLINLYYIKVVLDGNSVEKQFQKIMFDRQSNTFKDSNIFQNEYIRSQKGSGDLPVLVDSSYTFEQKKRAFSMYGLEYNITNEIKKQKLAGIKK